MMVEYLASRHWVFGSAEGPRSIDCLKIAFGFLVLCFGRNLRCYHEEICGHYTF